jgi:hypothetical protein
MTYDNPSQTKNLNNLLKNKVAFVTGAGSGIGRAGAMAMDCAFGLHSFVWFSLIQHARNFVCNGRR